MTKSIFPDDLEIALGYTVADWKKLELDADSPDTDDWEKAVKIFQTRLEGRFLEPADVLIKENVPHKTVFGFAVLASDFLVIEDLQGFRQGVVNHRGEHKKLVKAFLKDWDAFTRYLPDPCNPDELAGRIYEGYRCGIAHTGTTDGAFRVRAEGPTFTFENKHEITINRTCFHEELKNEFNIYLDKLRAPDKDELRTNFIRKMNAICGVSND